MNKRWLKFAIPVVVVALIAAGAVAFYMMRESGTDEPDGANVELIDRGMQALIDDDAETLAIVVKDIEDEDDYQQTPEYLYILAKHYSSPSVNNLDRSVELIDAFKATNAAAEYRGKMQGMRYADIVKGLENDIENLRARIAGQSKEGEPSWAD